MPHVESAAASDGPPLQDAWHAEFQRLVPLWESLRNTSEVIIPISISRVNQFDAARLDVEMSAMLKEQLVKVFSLMKPGFLFQYEPELDAFLEFLIWRFSIWVDKPTPGNALMNLKYRDERAAPITGKEGIFLLTLCQLLSIFLYGMHLILLLQLIMLVKCRLVFLNIFA